MTFNVATQRLLSLGFIRNGSAFRYWRPGDDQEAVIEQTSRDVWAIRFLKD